MRRPQAVVTGAGVRIGRAIALELSASGFEVAVHYRGSSVAAEETAQLCVEAGGAAWTVQADLGTPEGCDSLVGAVAARGLGVHVLVNNASIFEPVPFESLDLAAWERMQAINLRAPFLVSKGLLPQLRAAEASELGGPTDQGGLVVHLCDIGADRPVSGYAHYSVSKAGLVMLVRAMAVELAPRVRTVGISPGQVMWPEWYDEKLRAKLEKRIPMGRAGGGKDCARLVRFLAKEAFYLNGVVIPVDGGLSLRY